jgi:hypothetical protein
LPLINECTIVTQGLARLQLLRVIKIDRVDSRYNGRRLIGEAIHPFLMNRLAAPAVSAVDGNLSARVCAVKLHSIYQPNRPDDSAARTAAEEISLHQTFFIKMVHLLDDHLSNLSSSDRAEFQNC